MRHSGGPNARTLSIGSPILPADIPVLCAKVHALLETGPEGPILCDLSSLVEPDAVAVEVLARLQLAARRHGREVRLLHASSELLDLLALTGLDEAAGLCVETEREVEEREDRLGVEEERDAGDRPI